MEISRSLAPIAAGAAGALALNAFHETGRQLFRHAPHMDFIGMRALGKPLQRVGKAPKNLTTLRRWTLVGDVISNSLYYAAIAWGDQRPAAMWRRGFALGLGAGVGAVFLPPRMGLGQQKTERPAATFGMTIAWYLIGGLVSAATLQAIRGFGSTEKAE